MAYTLKCIIIFLIIPKDSLEFNYDINDAEDNNIGEVVFDVAKPHIPKDSDNVIFTFGNIPSKLAKLLTAETAYVTLSASDNIHLEEMSDYSEESIVNLIGLSIIFTSEFNELTDTVKHLAKSAYWKYDGHFIVVIEESDSITVGKMLYLFWWYRVVNVVIIRRDMEEYVLSEYQPYPSDQHRFGNVRLFCWSLVDPKEYLEASGEKFGCRSDCDGNFKIDGAVSMQECVDIRETVFNKRIVEDLFPDRVNDLHGRKMKTTNSYAKPLNMVDPEKKGLERFSGRGALFFIEFSKYLNFEIDFDEDTVMADPNFEHILQTLFDCSYRKVDFFVIEIYLVPMPYPPLSMTYAHDQSGLCFIVHEAKFIPRWLRLTAMFDRESISSIIGLGVVIVAVYASKLYVLKRRSLLDCILIGFTNAVLIFLSMSCKTYSDRLSFRVFLYAMLIFVFAVNFLLQGEILGLMTVARRYANIDTFEQLVDADMPLIGHPGPDNFLPETSELFTTINRRFRPDSDFNRCIHDLAEDPGVGCWHDCSVATYFARTLLDREGDLHLHVGRDKIHSHFIGYPLMKDSPLLKKWLMYSMYTNQAGLVQKWRGFKDPVVEGVAAFRPLNQEDIQLPIYLLLFLDAIAVTILTLEVGIETLYSGRWKPAGGWISRQL